VAQLDRQPWERQPKETPRAFAHFALYRDQDAKHRSVNRLLSEMADDGQQAANVSTIRAWSARYKWVDRCAAWDDEQDRVRREKALDELIRMAQLHARVASAQVNVMARPTSELLRRIRENEDILSELPIGQLWSMVISASKAMPGMMQVERFSRAEPTAGAMPSALDEGGRRRVYEPRQLVEDVGDAAAAWGALREAGLTPEEVEDASQQMVDEIVARTMSGETINRALEEEGLDG
jgi:hypothetical protein